MNDIDMEDVSYIDRVNFYIQTTTDTSTGGDYNNIKIRHNKLDIDGNNHYLSMGINNLALTGHQFYGPEDPKYVYKEDWTLENIDTYGSSYWGVISCNTGISANRIIAQTGKDPDTGNKVIDPNTNKYVVPGKNSYADG